MEALAVIKDVEKQRGGWGKEVVVAGKSGQSFVRRSSCETRLIVASSFFSTSLLRQPEHHSGCHPAVQGSWSRCCSLSSVRRGVCDHRETSTGSSRTFFLLSRNVSTSSPSPSPLTHARRPSLILFTGSLNSSATISILQLQLSSISATRRFLAISRSSLPSHFPTRYSTFTTLLLHAYTHFSFHSQIRALILSNTSPSSAVLVQGFRVPRGRFLDDTNSSRVELPGGSMCSGPTRN